MFHDQSSLTIGPNSELVIDHFIYDPKTDNGDLSISVTKGILRFVGGALSKKGKVTVETPVGNLGIRGAVVLIEVAQDGGEARGCILYGNELSGTASESNITKRIQEQEQWVIITLGGEVSIAPLSSDQLQKMLGLLQGPPSNTLPVSRTVTLPDNYSGWLRELSRQDTWDRFLMDDEGNADVFNRDIDDLAS